MPRRSLQAREQVQDLALDRDVEPGGRLVGDDQPGLQRERAGDADPARLAARELVRIAVEEVGAQPDHREQARRLRAADRDRAGGGSGTARSPAPGCVRRGLSEATGSWNIIAMRGADAA